MGAGAREQLITCWQNTARTAPPGHQCTALIPASWPAFCSWPSPLSCATYKASVEYAATMLPQGLTATPVIAGLGTGVCSASDEKSLKLDMSTDDVSFIAAVLYVVLEMFCGTPVPDGFELPLGI